MEYVIGFGAGICVAFIAFYIYTRKPVYLHFKGELYNLIGEAHNSEQWDEMWIVYQSQKQGYLAIRPKAMFFEDVVKDGYQGPRFIKVRG